LLTGWEAEKAEERTLSFKVTNEGGYQKAFPSKALALNEPSEVRNKKRTLLGKGNPSRRRGMGITVCGCDNTRGTFQQAGAVLEEAA